MRSLKLQPMRRHVAAGITIAITSAFIALTVLAVNFLSATMNAQFADAVEGSQLIVDPNIYKGDGTIESAGGLADVRSIEGVHEAFYVSMYEYVNVTSSTKPANQPAVASVWIARSGMDVTYTSGAAPTREHEVSVDETFARSQGLSVGDSLSLTPQGSDVGAQDYTVSGIYAPRLSQLFSGSSGLMLTSDGFARTFAGSHAEGIIPNSIAVIAADSTSVNELNARIKDAGFEAQGTGDYLHVMSEGVFAAMIGLSALLAGFILIALATSALVVSNSFAVTMAQRRRSFALARALGATRAQAMHAVIRDALIVGALGALAGIALAYLGAWALLALGRATWSPAVPSLPSFSILAIVLPFIAGLILALAGSLTPAIGAMRVKPLEALRPVEALSHGRSSKIRVALFAILVVVGLAFAALSYVVISTPDPSGDTPMYSMLLAFVSALSLLIAVVVGLPVMVPPIARIGHALARRLGLSNARFAMLNVARHPKRTGTTMAALVIGTALMATMATGARVAEDTLVTELNSRMPVDVVVAANPLDEASLAKLESVRGLDDTRRVPAVNVAVPGHDDMTVFAPTQADLDAVANLEGLRAPRDGEVLMGEQRAESFGLTNGGTLEVKGSDGGLRTVTVRTDGALGMSFMSPATFDSLKLEPATAFFGSLAESGSAKRADRDASEIVNDVYEVAGSLPATSTIMMMSTEGTERELFGRVITGMLMSSVALLAVAVVVALVGVANTLSLSVIERSGEYALMRALGTSRGAIRSMLAWEGAFIAVIGSVIGVILGATSGLMGVRSLIVNDFTFKPSLPWGYLGIVLAAGLVAGILASVVPGIRASSAEPAAALAERDE